MCPAKNSNSVRNSNPFQESRFTDQHSADVPCLATKTSGQIFADGQAIEIVRPVGADTTNLALLHYNDDQSRIASNLELNGKTYEAAELSPTLLRAMPFPTEPRPFGSAATLIKNQAAIIAKYSGLPGRFSRWTAFFSTATWLSDAVGYAPQLIVHGSHGRAAAQLITILNCLCRHPIVVADVAAGGLLSLPFPFGLTLLIRHGKMTERVKQFLLAARTENQFIFHSGRFVSVFCPVVLQVEEPAGNSEMAGLELPMRTVRQEIPLLDSATAEAIAKEYQDQLLAYRLANLQTTRKSGFDPAELISPIRETARSIGACFSSDPQLQEEIIALLRNSDAHARVLSSTSQEAATIEAMLFLCHERNGKANRGIHVGEIARAVSAINEGRQQIEKLSPRAQGNVLRTLGFMTDKIDRNGRGIMLCSDIRRRVHEIGMDLRVPSLAEGMKGCVDCQFMREQNGR